MGKPIEDMITALEKAKQAHELLEQIWLEMGPYTPHLTENLRFRLQNYFDFDDSE